MSKLLSSIAGGGGLMRLAPDLTHPSGLSVSTSPFIRIAGINAVGVLTTALSLTGKHSIGLLSLTGLTAETVTVKLTVDDVVIWNDTFTSLTALVLFGGSSIAPTTPFICNNSMLLELQTLTDTSVTLDYIARPIL